MGTKVEIWNIFVVSMLLMLLYAALNPACSVMNTSLQDSDTQLTSKLGYISQSLMSLFSIVGSIIAPPLRAVLGYRSIMVFSALLHMAVYIGMIILTKWAVLIGSIVTGLGEGIIWVVIPNFVTITSEHRNIERNLSYHMFIYNFNGIAGNILNYLCLDESTAITDSSRIRYFTVCTVFTLISAVLGGLAVCSPNSRADQFSSLNEDSDLKLISDIEPDTTQLLPDSDAEKTLDYNSEEHIPQTLYQRSLAYISEPSIRALTISSLHLGAVSTLMVIVPMCISNTYDDRHLIPILGGAIGISRMVTTGLFDWMARMTSYTMLQYLQTIVSLTWVMLVFLVFPDNSLHELTPGQMPLLPVGDWVVYVLGTLTGCCLTWLGVLVTVATGKVSTDNDAMKGFQPDILFAYTIIVWSIGSTVTLAITPYVSLYFFCCLSFVGITVNHFCFCSDLLPYIGKVVKGNGDNKPISY